MPLCFSAAAFHSELLSSGSEGIAGESRCSVEGGDGTTDGGGGSRGPSLVLGIQSSSDSPRYWTVGVPAGTQVIERPTNPLEQS